MPKKSDTLNLMIDDISDEGKIIITKASRASNDWRRTEDIIIDLVQNFLV